MRIFLQLSCVFSLSILVGCGGSVKDKPVEPGELVETLMPDTTQVERPGVPQPPNTQPLTEAQQQEIAEAEHEFDLWCEKFLKNEDWESVMHDYKVALVKSNKMGETMDADAYRGFLDSIVYHNRLDYILPTVPLKPQEKGLNLKGFKTILEVFDDDAQALPPASSLHGYYRAFDRIIESKNIYPNLLAQVFIDEIRPEDLGKPFYQDIVLIFLIVSANESSGIESQFPNG